ncbi:hypothetical protein ABZ807_11390 [Micromonospora sp. NPDC047548]|uniref:hypothetical protein n=1 Tax=Micromonospora sp. NPDC047548 TaxID=3155624 RepID=UPI0033F0DBDA
MNLGQTVGLFAAQLGEKLLKRWVSGADLDVRLAVAVLVALEVVVQEEFARVVTDQQAAERCLDGEELALGPVQRQQALQSSQIPVRPTVRIRIGWEVSGPSWVPTTACIAVILATTRALSQTVLFRSACMVSANSRACGPSPLRLRVANGHPQLLSLKRAEVASARHLGELLISEVQLVERQTSGFPPFDLAHLDDNWSRHLCRRSGHGEPPRAAHGTCWKPSC